MTNFVCASRLTFVSRVDAMRRKRGAVKETLCRHESFTGIFGELRPSSVFTTSLTITTTLVGCHRPGQGLRRELGGQEDCHCLLLVDDVRCQRGRLSERALGATANDRKAGPSPPQTDSTFRTRHSRLHRPTRAHAFPPLKCKNPRLSGGGSWLREPDDYLLSHGNPHYHRRRVVSRSCSGWEGVGPTRYGHQAKRVVVLAWQHNQSGKKQ